MNARLAIVIAISTLTACGGQAPPRAPDETTETWTSGDDEALGITSEAAAPEGERGSSISAAPSCARRAPKVVPIEPEDARAIVPREAADRARARGRDLGGQRLGDHHARPDGSARAHG